MLGAIGIIWKRKLATTAMIDFHSRLPVDLYSVNSTIIYQQSTIHALNKNMTKVAGTLHAATRFLVFFVLVMKSLRTN